MDDCVVRCRARPVMTPAILLFYLLLNSSCEDATKAAPPARQRQLGERIFPNHPPELTPALALSSNSAASKSACTRKGARCSAERFPRARWVMTTRQGTTWSPTK